MKRIIKYVIYTRNRGLKMTPQRKDNIMNIFAYSDSDFADNKEYRISVSGFIILLKYAPIICHYKAQRSVKSSSSEAEYVALSESAK